MSIFNEAKWIWNANAVKVNSYVTFRFEAELDASQKHGMLKHDMLISADTNYALYINGVLAEFGQYADYPFDKVYDSLDITKYIVNGKNEFVINCYHQGDDSSTVRGEEAGLIFELNENDSLIIASGSGISSAVNSRYANGPVEKVSGQLGYSFRYDANADIGEFSDSVIINKPYPVRSRPVRKLIVGDKEPEEIKVIGTFTEHGGHTTGERMMYSSMAYRLYSANALPSEKGIALSCSDNDDGVFVIVDTGRENSGVLDIDIDVENECEILVGWGEHLHDMRVRASVGGRNFCCSYKAHKGRNTFVHPFRRLGCRYLQVHIYSREVRLYYAGIRTTDYPLSYWAEFTCADKLHTKIYSVCERTLLMSIHEHYEDCPWREQALYSMDSRNQMLCGYYAFHEFDMPKASIRLMAQSIRDDDMLELCSPARVSITIPSFTAIFLTQLYEYLEHSGDKEFALEMLPTARRIANGFIGRINPENGLIECYKEERYWNFYEWQEGLAGSIAGSISDENATYDAPLCAFVSAGLRSLARIMDILGYSDESEYYMNAHRLLNSATDKWFWNEEMGVYASFIRNGEKLNHYCELTNSLILFADASDGERKASVLEALANKTLLPVTLSHSIFKYDVLMSNAQKYARVVFNDIAERWGYMLYNNATTFWETIDGGEEAFGGAGSLCHGWSAIPICFYHKYALELPGEVTGLYECKVK